MMLYLPEATKSQVAIQNKKESSRYLKWTAVGLLLAGTLGAGWNRWTASEPASSSFGQELFFKEEPASGNRFLLE